MPDSPPPISVTIPPGAPPGRADKLLAGLLPEHTRGTVQDWLRRGLVTRDEQPITQKHQLTAGQTVRIILPPPAPIVSEPQDIALDLAHEDDQLLIINKPDGLVVHPGAGNPDATLLNAVLHHCPGNAALPRAGIVHRLDKGTTGLLAVAKTEPARQALIDQLATRQMQRRYLTVVEGVLISGRTVDAPIGRRRHDRLRMAVTAAGKPAVTRLRVQQKFRRHSLLQAELETGRTHQIRVHLAHVGHPVAGDKTYGSRGLLPPNCPDALRAALQSRDHPALHACRLTLTHPRSGETVSWEAPPPADFAELVALLAEDAGA